MITSRWEWSRFCLNMALTKRPPLKICTTRLTYSAMTGPKPRIFWNCHNLKENIVAALEDLLTTNLLPHPRQHLTIWMNLQITPPSLQVRKDFQCTGSNFTNLRAWHQFRSGQDHIPFYPLSFSEINLKSFSTDYTLLSDQLNVSPMKPKYYNIFPRYFLILYMFNPCLVHDF